ncbi:MAG TPA: ComEC/Rec2 family competence protein [Patescibacteria group bacterium]|nr:ComEC/Rec2 family competence protein [Patescibacteria group bacterium]
MKQYVVFISIIISLVLIRLFLFFNFSPSLKDGQEVVFHTVITSVPQPFYLGQKVTVFLKNSFGSIPIVLILKTTTLGYGDDVTISGKITNRVLGNKKTDMVIYSPTISFDTSPKSILFHLSQRFSEKIAVIYQKGLPSEYAGLLLGIVLGVKRDMSQQSLKLFQMTGVTHVVAASGMNVTLLAGMVMGVLGFLSRKQRVYVTILFILLFCVISGAQASIVRASIMSIAIFASQLVGRQYTPWYGLFLAASGMILLSPELVLDTGFQLSFAATGGMVLVNKRIRVLTVLGDDFSSTVSAQLTTLPIILATFGQYGLSSLPVNLLLLWTVAPLMILGGLSAIIGLVFQPLGSIIAGISYPLLWYFFSVVGYFAKMPFFLQHIVFLPVSIVGYYFCLFAFLLFTKKEKREEK